MNEEETARRTELGRLRQQYHDALMDDVLPFWEKYSIDEECGGYFTCLDREGRVYDTDKFVWLQTRQVWMFSLLHQQYERREDWLQIARHGVAFLKKHGRAPEGNWYFSLTREGTPLVQPHDWFTDCFAAMGFGCFALITGDEEARDIAVRTFENLLRRKEDPKGKYNKRVAGTRPLKSVAFPMMLGTLALELEGVIEEERLNQVIDAAIEEITTLFYDRRRAILIDNVLPDGSQPDCFEGRTIIPGHGIEVGWLLLEIGRRRGDSGLVDLGTQVILNLLKIGWDQKYGGVVYYHDLHGKPPVQLEWDRKLWWVHIECLVALLRAYALTHREDVWQWYEKLHEYTWQRFPDPEHGEWFGYLDRQGEPFLTLKGGKWKGCFHVPRGLYWCYRELEALS